MPRAAAPAIGPILLLLGCGPGVPAADPPEELPLESLLQPPPSHANSGGFAARLDELRREIAALGPGHAWAGEYYTGDGLGVNVTLLVAPSGYAYEWRGCLGVYAERSGTLAVRDEVLELDGLPGADRAPPGLASQLRVVRWAPRTYLLTPEQFDLLEADDLEPRPVPWGCFLQRRGDEARRAAGEPDLPR